MNQKTKILLESIKKNNKRAFNSLIQFIKKDSYDSLNAMDYLVYEYSCELNFNKFRGIVYSFFDTKDIIISVYPISVLKKGGKTICKWSYYINIDGNDISEGDFEKREYAEFIAFQKAFQFLDTKMFIDDTKNRFEDEKADSSCLNVNWEHLDKVLSFKRKNLM
jgi:hypothetical protein